ncbi:MAG: hypothetical protein LBQ43_00515 [Holosporales bacterium]|jgi:hypothetical protein|nr:hypothetical protein [Holosporales bacterium]
MSICKVLLCSSIFAILAGNGIQAGGLSEEQKKEVAQLVDENVRKMLTEHPEEFISAIDAGVQKRQYEFAKKIEQNATTNKDKLFGARFVIGNAKGPLKLVVFFDPLDPISQKFNSEVMSQIAKERTDVGFYLTPVSIYGGQEGGDSGPSSLLATKAIIAASLQNVDKTGVFWSKFPDAHGKIELTVTRLSQLAKESELDADKLSKDIESEAIARELEANGQLAVDIGIPPRLPLIFISTDKGLEIIPPLVKEKMNQALDAVKNGRPWQEILIAPGPEAAAEGKPAAEAKLEAKPEAKPEGTPAAESKPEGAASKG